VGRKDRIPHLRAGPASPVTLAIPLFRVGFIALCVAWMLFSSACASPQVTPTTERSEQDSSDQRESDTQEASPRHRQASDPETQRGRSAQDVKPSQESDDISVATDMDQSDEAGESVSRSNTQPQREPRPNDDTLDKIDRAHETPIDDIDDPAAAAVEQELRTPIVGNDTQCPTPDEAMYLKDATGVLSSIAAASELLRSELSDVSPSRRNDDEWGGLITTAILDLHDSVQQVHELPTLPSIEEIRSELGELATIASSAGDSAITFLVRSSDSTDAAVKSLGDALERVENLTSRIVHFCDGRGGWSAGSAPTATTEPCPTEAESIYFRNLSTHTDTQVDAITQLGTLFSQIPSNPELLHDAAWRSAVEDALLSLQAAASRISELDRPVRVRYEIDLLVNYSAEDIAAAAWSIDVALENGNAQLFEQAVELLDASAQRAPELASAISRFCD